MSLVAEASNGREAIERFRAHRPDITLMDLQMPEMNGLDAMIAIRGEFPEARIIVLTTYTGDVQVLRAMKVGARAYLLKSLLDKELLETIRAVHAGSRGPPADCGGECQQADRCGTLHHRGNREGTSQEHPLQIRRERSNPRSHDRGKARNYPILVTRNSCQSALLGLLCTFLN